MNENLNVQLSRLVEQVDQTEKDIEDLKSKMKQKEELLRELTGRRIPDLMDQMESQEVLTKAGLKVKVEPFVAVSINKDNKDEALAWLVAQGHGGVVKREVIVEFRAGDEGARKLYEQVKDLPCRKVELKEGVHDQTMKALGRELMAAGQLFPDCFNVFTGRIAKITHPKDKKLT